MAYTLATSIALGSANAGQTLKAQLVDTAGADVGSEVSTGFVEFGGGYYLWTYDAFPDGFRGAVKILRSDDVLLTIVSINPQETENADVKTSSVVLGGQGISPSAVDGAAVLPLVSRDRVKVLLNIDATDDGRDDVLDTLILVASTRILDICQQPIIATAVSIEFDGDCLQTHVLERRPVSSISALEYRELATPDDDWQEVDETYVLAKPRGVAKVLYPTGFSPCRAYRVTCVVGYAQDAVPEVVQQVCAEMAMVMYKESDLDADNSRLGLNERILREVGNVQATSDEKYRDMLPVWRRALAPYAR